MSQEEFNAKVIAQSTPEQLAELFDEACQLVYNLGDDLKYLDNLHKVVRKLEINVEQDCDCPSCQKQCKLTNQDWLKMATGYTISKEHTLVLATDGHWLINATPNSGQWRFLDKNANWVIKPSEAVYFPTKEVAYMAYLEWKQAKESE